MRGLGLLVPESVVVEQLTARVERLERRDAVVRHPVRARVRELVGAQQVAPAQLGGVDAPSCAPRCRAASRGRASRTATARGTRCARRCSCRRSCTRSSPAGTWYGPGNNVPTAAAVITGHGVGYAPESDTKSMSDRLDDAVAVERDPDVGGLVARLARPRAGSRDGPRSTSPAAEHVRPASMRHISSRCTMIFWPKPPPVSRITTRTRCSGMPSRREQNAGPRAATASRRRS